MSMLNTENLDALSLRVIALICEQCGLSEDQIALEMHFAQDLQFDSLDQVEFLMAIEEEFVISVPEEVVDKIQTVQDTIKTIRLLSEKNPKQLQN